MRDAKKTSKKAMGNAVEGILGYLLELYTVEGVDAVSELEKGFETARDMCIMYDLREFGRVKRLLDWMNADLRAEGYHDEVIEVRMFSFENELKRVYNHSSDTMTRLYTNS